jgi:FkbM family methyltransferase
MSLVRRLVGAVYDRIPFKQPMLTALKPLGLPEPVYKHLHFQGEIVVRTPGRPFRIIHYGDEIENELFWEGLPGHRERISMGLWMQLCPSARTVVDVGANSGVYALAASGLNPSARVLAFEPLPEEHARLARNIELNEFEIHAPRVGLSDKEGVASMVGWTITQPTAGSTEVRLARLDEILDAQGIDRVDLMKIDVEGHEPEVLRGFGRRLAQDRPTLLIEVLSDAAAAHLRQILDPLDYEYFDIDEINPPRRVDTLRKSTHWNVLACQPIVARQLFL